jgi:3-dehydroquinate synthase
MKLTVELGARSYPIHIAPGALAEAGALTAALGGRPTVAVVTDETVAARHLDTLRRSLEAAGRLVEPLILPPGEATKSWPHLEALTERLLALGVERGDFIVALGGGVIGDLAGFAAAILRRGCRFVQVPTTLLSQVDSSVGGKTAIDARAGKNLIGAFHQPSLVLIDPAVLATLPDRELRAGYAEIVKIGLIGDAGFFDWCDANLEAVLRREPGALAHAIETAVRAKAEVVAADEHETLGTRALLNLGHTFGHALEAEAGFSDLLLHGEAVACGMVLAFRLSAELGLCPADDAARVAAHVARAGLPSDPRQIGLGADAATLVRHMTQDKKMQGGRLGLILARGIGRAFVTKEVELAQVEAFLARALDGAGAPQLA